MLTCWTVAPLSYSRAVLTEITVVGGGALTLEMLLDLLMTAFGASGMDGAVRNQAAAAGTPPVPYIGNLLNRFLNVTLSAVLPSEWAQQISNGLSVLPNGTLFLDSEATAAVADFQRWAWDSDGGNLEQFAVIGTTDGNLHGGGFTAYAVNCNVGPVNFVNAQTTDWYYSNVDLFSNSTRHNYLMVTGQTGRAYVILREATNVSRPSAAVWAYVPTIHSKVSFATSLYSPGLVDGGQPFSWNVSGTWQQLVIFSLSDYPNHLPLQSGSGTIPDISDMIGDSAVVGDVDTFVGPSLEGQGTEIPLGDVVTVSPEAAGRLHLANYLRAVSAAYAGSGVADLPLTDEDTGEDETFPVSVPLDSPIGVTGVTDSAIDQSGAQAGTDAISSDFAGVDDYTMDLTQYFPFCIPFDISLLFQKFEAEAEAPVIEWPVPVPGQEEPYLVRLDFSAFDDVAALLRKLELIAFAVGLCFLTKNLIQGGD